MAGSNSMGSRMRPYAASLRPPRPRQNHPSPCPASQPHISAISSPLTPDSTPFVLDHHHVASHLRARKPPRLQPSSVRARLALLLQEAVGCVLAPPVY